MNSLRELRLIIRTGERAHEGDVVVRVNGFRLVARVLAGGTFSGETMLSSMYIGQAVSTLRLCNEEPSPWDVDYAEVFGLMSDGQVLHHKTIPEAALADGRELDMWPALELQPASEPEEDEGFEV